MDDDHSDLLTLISEARRLVTDDRYIWCCSSDGFDSRCVQRRGLLLGGALSPHFLRDTAGMWSEIPWTLRLQHCRVVVCDKAAQEPVSVWLPLMEGVAGAGESLLVVTETIDSELLHTFIVNGLRRRSPCASCVRSGIATAAWHPARNLSPDPAPRRPSSTISFRASPTSGFAALPPPCFQVRTRPRWPPPLFKISPSSKPAGRTTRTSTTGFAF